MEYLHFLIKDCPHVSLMHFHNCGWGSLRVNNCVSHKGIIVYAVIWHTNNRRVYYFNIPPAGNFIALECQQARNYRIYLVLQTCPFLKWKMIIRAQVTIDLTVERSHSCYNQGLQRSARNARRGCRALVAAVLYRNRFNPPSFNGKHRFNLSHITEDNRGDTTEWEGLSKFLMYRAFLCSYWKRNFKVKLR